MNLKLLHQKGLPACLILLGQLAAPGNAGAAESQKPAAPVDSASSTPPVLGVLTPAEEQADFDLMRRALEEAQTGLYRYTPKAEMDKVFTATRAKLNRPLNKLEFLALLSEDIARIRCGHTNVGPDAETHKVIESALLLPLKVMMEGKRLMVVSNGTPDDATIRPGMELLEVNGHKVSSILARIPPLLQADGDIETGKRLGMSQGFSQYYWWLFEQPKEFTVKARDINGRIVTAKLAGMTQADQAKSQNPVNAPLQANLDKLDWAKENLSLRFLKDPEVAEIRIHYFVGDDYPKWIEETFKTLQAKGTKSLIIDLRANGGGDDMYGAMLVSYLTDKPFRYFDHINLKTFTPSFKEFTDWGDDAARDRKMREGTTPNPAGGYLINTQMHPGVGEQQPGKYPFLGKVFVLTSGRTFSTAADFCAVAHHLKRATFIGEETGGGYYGNNSGMETFLTLPNSKLPVRIPMCEYWNAVPGYSGTRRGTIPDYPVETRVADLLKGTDASLELALKLAEAHKGDARKL